MKITLRQFAEGAKLSLADTLKMEYRISQGCMVSLQFLSNIFSDI